MRKWMMAAGAAVIAASAACAGLGLGGFQEPVVTVRDVVVNGVGLNGGSVDINLNVYNPNRFDLDGTRLTYTLWVDSVQFGTGTTSERFVVQDKDSAVVRLPLSFTWSGVGAAGRALMNTGTVNYRVAGDITVGSAVGNFTVPYDRNGRFSPLRGGR